MCPLFYIDLISNNISSYLKNKDEFDTSNFDNVYNCIISNVLSSKYIDTVTVDNDEKLKIISKYKFRNRIILDIQYDEITESKNIMNFVRLNPSCIIKKLHTLDFIDFIGANIETYELFITHEYCIDFYKLPKINIKNLIITEHENNNINSRTRLSDLYFFINTMRYIYNTKIESLTLNINESFYYYKEEGFKLPTTLKKLIINIQNKHENYNPYDINIIDKIDSLKFLDKLQNLEYFECNYLELSYEDKFIDYLNMFPKLTSKLIFSDDYEYKSC